MSEVPLRPTVLDTSVVSNFAYVDCVGLLETLPRPVTVPTVRQELNDGVATHPFLRRAVEVLGDDIPVVSLPPGAEAIEAGLLERLDPGEAAVLALVEDADGTVVTDDGDARAVARERGLRVTGSIGLLVRFVEAERLDTTEADAILDRWIDDAGFRSPARDIEEFLDE